MKEAKSWGCLKTEVVHAGGPEEQEHERVGSGLTEARVTGGGTCLRTLGA